MFTDLCTGSVNTCPASAAAGEQVAHDLGRPVTRSELKTRDLLPQVQATAAQLAKQFH
ncbi:hypothetical protein [Streptomyces sp. NPDC051219]|uniref:hypothetical protein n=1 Tax=Streptomyces sp. NPDC051219 TaxID=3155283 RepID=UPI00343E5E80